MFGFVHVFATDNNVGALEMMHIALATIDGMVPEESPTRLQ